MREILFRGKSYYDGDWLYGTVLFLETADMKEKYVAISPILDGVSSYKEIERVVPETVGQFTGLTDKNGTKIFEGDIVNILPEVDEIGVIEWADDEAMFEVVAGGWCGNFDNYLPEDLEVISNIHDNPELMEVDNG